MSVEMTFLAIAMILAVLSSIKDNRADGHGEEISSLEGSFRGYLEYQGCFKTPTKFIKKRTDSQNNNNHCAEFCQEVGARFSATSDEDCYCLDAKPKGKDTLFCDIFCPDKSNKQENECSFPGDCCGGKNHVSVYSPESTPEKDEAERRRNTGSLNVQGCFSDEVSSILEKTETLRRVDSANTMLRCSKFCLDKGFPVASLRTDHCYCTNVLPLERLYEGVDNTKECNLFCSGVYGKEGRCERDQCCGGQQEEGRHTYTVFISGTLDVLKQMLRRINTNFGHIPNDLAQLVWNDRQFCPRGWKVHNTFCYQFSNEKRNFNDAKNDCEQKNAHLFTVQTEEDRVFWNKQLKPYTKVKSVWVGLTWDQNERRWNWMNGKPYEVVTPSKQSKCPTLRVWEIAFAAVQLRRYIKYTFDKITLKKNLGPFPSYDDDKFVRLNEAACSEKVHYFCQSYLKLVVRGQNPTSSKGEATFQVQSMEIASPDFIIENPSDQKAYKKDEVIKMSVVEFKEQIKKEMSPSTKFLAGSDVVFRNKEKGSKDTKFTYTHTTESSSGVTVTTSSGASVAVTAGMEFETSYFGLASNKFSASVEVTGNWEKGTETYTTETESHSYQFEFPVPAKCDATIAIMKKELPTRIDWRATFYCSGWIDVQVVGRKKTVDVTRLLKNTQRYLYSFGTNDFGKRPTIVPVKTLDCVGEDKPKKEEMKDCKNPKTGKIEKCEVKLKVPKTRKQGKQG